MTELERVRWEDAVALMREAADALEKHASHDEHDAPGDALEWCSHVCEVCREESQDYGKMAHADGCVVPRLRDYAAGIETGLRPAPPLRFLSVWPDPDPGFLDEARRIVPMVDTPNLVTIARDALGEEIKSDSLLTVDRLEDGGWFRYLDVPVENLTEYAATLNLKRASLRAEVPPRQGTDDAPA
jgi:hypothetical protein